MESALRATGRPAAVESVNPPGAGRVVGRKHRAHEADGNHCDAGGRDRRDVQRAASSDGPPTCADGQLPAPRRDPQHQRDRNVRAGDEQHDPSSQLASPWLVYGFEVEGRSVAEVYRDAPGGRLLSGGTPLADAQRAAWLSVWEIETVEPGRSLTLHDLLSADVGPAPDRRSAPAGRPAVE